VRKVLIALAAALILGGCASAVTGSAAASTPALDVPPSALALQQQFVRVVKQVGPSVVLVRTSEGLGSGVVFDAAGLRPAAFADSSRLQVGDLALAIGNPLGLQSSVTEGIVSAFSRTVNEDNGVALPNVIQTSAAINPGTPAARWSTSRAR
jgi:putative serine protease PepD